MADHYKIPYYKSLTEMLAKEEIDCVDVATNEKLRPEPIIECFRAGKHVFTEKPLAGARGQYDVRGSDLDIARRMVDAWRASGKHFGINFNYRTAPHAMALKKAVAEGRIGEPISINVYAHLDCWSHVIDLMRWLNGDVAELCGYIGTGKDPRPRAAALKFENGTVGTLTGVMHNREHLILKIEYLGTLGRGVIYELTGECQLFPQDPKKPKEILWAPPDGNPRGAFSQTFVDSVQSFARAVRDGKEPPVTMRDAYRELEIDALIPVSAERGQPVRLEHYV
jgi:predicted dehydrogenase